MNGIIETKTVPKSKETNPESTFIDKNKYKYKITIKNYDGC